MRKRKVFSVDRLPKRVQAYFQDAKTVSDATESIAIRVGRQDQKIAKAKDPTACAMAQACKREQEADGVWVGIGTAYVLNGTHLTRYITPPSVAREIVSFDRHQDFRAGAYTLNAPPPSQQYSKTLGTKKDPHRGDNVTKDGSKSRRKKHVMKRHRTIGVRTWSQMAAEEAQ